MHSVSKVLLIFVSFFILGGCAKDNGPADSPIVSTKTKDKLTYLSPDSIVIGKTLPPPPVLNSSAAQVDLRNVLTLQNKRTQADCTRANTEVTYTLDTLFGPAYGPLSAAEVTKWNPFFKNVLNDIVYFTKKEKAVWGRPRPYMVSTQVHPCVPPDDSASYPSGHSTIAHVLADVLSEIDPSRQAAFQARANQVAEDRVVGGVHFPTDIAAGQTLSEQLFTALTKNPVFVTDVKNLH